MNEKVETKVIGIPAWWWKKPLLKKAGKIGRVINMPTGNLCYECSRHKELLEMFDRNDICWEKSEYYKYRLSRNKPEKGIIQKIKMFKSQYDSIKRKEISVEGAIVTDDGCRLDGSHRLSIAEYLGFSEVPVIVVSYEDVFDEKTSSDIRAQVRQYRIDKYALSTIER